jgi:hypothetical protein
MPIALYDKAQNKRLFEITIEQRNQLVDALEEESTKDRDYYIDANVIDFLTGKVDEELLAKLRPLVGASPAAPADAEIDAEMDDIPEMPEAAGEPQGIDIEWREE